MSDTAIDHRNREHKRTVGRLKESLSRLETLTISQHAEIERLKLELRRSDNTAVRLEDEVEKLQRENRELEQRLLRASADRARTTLIHLHGGGAA